DDDDGAVVGQLAARERAARREHRGCDLLRGPARVRREHVVEPLDTEQLTVAAGLDDAVREEDDRAATRKVRQDLVILLRGEDAERETAAVERRDTAVVRHETRLRV